MRIAVTASAPPNDIEVARVLVSVRRRIVGLVCRHGVELDGALEKKHASDPFSLDNPALAQIRGASVLGRRHRAARRPCSGRS